MGTCKKCGKVVSAIYMKDGFCPDCPPADGENTGVVFERINRSNEVSIVDIEIPFSSMVVLMVKWVLASIPAFMILFLIFFVFFKVAFSESMSQLLYYL